MNYEGLDLRRVEEVGLNALQTQRQLFYDGWLLRVSPGKARRARSVNAYFGSSLPLGQKIDYCERLYAQRAAGDLRRPRTEQEQHDDHRDERRFACVCVQQQRDRDRHQRPERARGERRQSRAKAQRHEMRRVLEQETDGRLRIHRK